ncbi:MAG: T9SS type A sorting domain-containing protein, partial [Candidatus Zixiibacteriota bacterium]
SCDGTITATFSGGTPGYMIEIDGGGFVSATSTHLFSDLCAGSHEVVVKDANDCADTANITVNQPTEVVLSLDSTDVLCYEGCDGTITATFSGGTPGYMIEIDGGGFVSATSTHLFSDLCAGSHQVVVKDANDCPDTANITLTEPPELLCTVSPLDTLICAGDSAQFCVNPTGGTPPFTFSWDGPSGFTSADSCIYAHDDGAYSVLVTDANACTTRCEGTLTTEPCGDEFCSLTQGAYGNAGGKYFGMGTLPLIQSLLTPSPLVVGKPGRSLTIPLAAAECIIKRLPGGGTADTLPAIGDDTFSWDACQTSPPLPLKKDGRFKNVFLAQTITLSLNVRLGCDLGTFELCDSIETKDASFGPDGEPCTEDDFIDPGPDGIPDTPDDPPAVGVLIPQPVLTALSGLGLTNTVDGLLELANRALAGQPTGGASLSQINMAVDNINNAFDECRFVTYCGPRISLVAMVKETGESSTLPEEFSLSQNYPNPFNPVCNIDYAIPIDCHVRLSVYNILGQKVRVLVDQHQSAGRRSVMWDGKDTRGQELTTGVYFYRIQAGDFTESRKMILIK